MSKNIAIRIGVALNDPQLERLREFTHRFGISQMSFFAACVDVLTDEEIKDVMRRFTEKRITKFAQEARSKVPS